MGQQCGAELSDHLPVYFLGPLRLDFSDACSAPTAVSLAQITGPWQPASLMVVSGAGALILAIGVAIRRRRNGPCQADTEHKRLATTEPSDACTVAEAEGAAAGQAAGEEHAKLIAVV